MRARRVLRHADLAQHLVDALAGRGAEPAEEPERGHEPGGHHLVHGHGQGGVERGPLGHVAEAPPLAERAGRMPEEPHRAARRAAAGPA